MRKRTLYRSLLVTLLVILVLFGWANWPTSPLPAQASVERIVVHKKKRLMTLIGKSGVIKTYKISLGANPVGHKERQGDERTPEGVYTLDWKNDRSICYLSIHISYPNEKDKLSAQKKGVDPGGSIMIHGILNGFGWVGKLHRLYDLTDGCIAVTNSEMKQLWDVVPMGTSIEIYP